MQTTLHFTQIDIQAEIAARMARISQELETLRRDDDLLVDISPQDLFYLEALGYRRVGRSFPVYLHPDTHGGNIDRLLERLSRRDRASVTPIVVGRSPRLPAGPRSTPTTLRHWTSSDR